MTAMESYVYSPLPSGDFIRLLILKPGTDGEVLKGTLHITPLDEVQVFEAISYVWGALIRPALFYAMNEQSVLRPTSETHYSKFAYQTSGASSGQIQYASTSRTLKRRVARWA